MVLELRRRVIPAALVLLAAFMVVALACAGPQPTATPTPEPVDPKKELRRTVEQLLALQSASFNLEHTVGSTNILPGILMNRAYGKVIVPGSFDITVEAELLFPRSYLEIGMVSIDGTAYMTNVLNGEWSEVPPESLPINLSTFGSTLAGIVEKVQSPELVGEERLNGVDVYHISGGIVSEDLLELVPTAGTGYPVALEMWIERATGILREAVITGQTVVTDVPDSQRRLIIDDVNQPVTIAPPVT